MQTGVLDAREGSPKYIHISIQLDEESHVVITDPSWPSDLDYALTQLGKALLELDHLRDEGVSEIFQKHGIQFLLVENK